MFSFLKSNQQESINIKEIDQLIGTIEIIDVREPVEYSTGSIKGSKNMPMNQLLIKPENYLRKDKKYHILCQSGMRSSRVASALTKQGFNVVNIKGGMSGYTGNNKQ